jgi:hypothetical protein
LKHTHTSFFLNHQLLVKIQAQTTVKLKQSEAGKLAIELYRFAFKEFPKEMEQ